MIPVAVAIIHGVEVSDSHFAKRAVEKLRHHFVRSLTTKTSFDPEQCLKVESVHWAPVLEPRQLELLSRAYPNEGKKLFNGLRRLTLQLNQGSRIALAPFAARLLSRTLFGSTSALHYPGLRWLAMHFIGDIVAYQPGTANRRNYDRVHDVLAASLGRLAERAGPNAPLCVLAHSFGSVIASDFFYDLQTGKRSGSETPLESGRTLSHFYTMGSPIALWDLSYESGLDSPIQVPSPDLKRLHPQMAGEWVNFYDSDDVIAWPLKRVSKAYDRAVTRDARVRLRVSPVSWSPLVHPFYWSNDTVMAPIGRSLATAWEKLNATSTAPAVQPRSKPMDLLSRISPSRLTHWVHSS